MNPIIKPSYFSLRIPRRTGTVKEFVDYMLKMKEKARKDFYYDMGRSVYDSRAQAKIDISDK